MFNITKYLEINDLLIKNEKKTKIIAISKNHTQESVISAINQGVRIFGENRVLEAKSKFYDLKKRFLDLELHLTGPLQSNKVKEAVKIFDVFHTLDREKIAKEFNKYNEFLTNKKFFVQVNTGEEKTKSGVLTSQTEDFVNFCIRDLNLNVVGLMCIPPLREPPSKHFKILQSLAFKIN